MSKILLTCGLNSSTNLGTAAQIISFTSYIKNFDPNLSISLFSYFPMLDGKLYSKYGIKVPEHNLSGNHVFVSMFSKQYFPVIKGISNDPCVCLPNSLSWFNEADLILDFNGDSISGTVDKNLIPSGLLVNTLPVIFGLLANKPVALFSQSIGPFDKLNYIFAKFLLQKTKLIVARDQVSYSYLKDMRLNVSLIMRSEVAFLLNPVCPSNDLFRPDRAYPLIGFSVSAFQGKSSNNYHGLIAGLLKWIVKELNGNIIFIPHVTDSTCDDRVEARQICTLVPEIKNRITLIENQLTPEEAKWLIGECDLFIASRWHASIAALSMGVPTISFGSSQKYWSTMEHLGLSDYAVNFLSSLDTLIFKTHKAWINRDLIRQHLKVQDELAKESAEDAVRSIAEMIKGRYP
jgi:colanic acid/amylovoran biosynthesis protein